MAIEVIYPGVRLDRAEPLSPLSAPPAPARPTVRLWPFALQETSPGDRQAASPFLYGPAIVDSLYLNYSDDNTAPTPTITVFYGPTVPPSGNTPVVNLTDLGTPMFTDGVISAEVGGSFQTPLQHIWKVTGTADTGRVPLILRFPIYLDQFQLLIRFGTQGGGSRSLTGHFRILERVPPEQFPNFL